MKNHHKHSPAVLRIAPLFFVLLPPIHKDDHFAGMMLTGSIVQAHEIIQDVKAMGAEAHLMRSDIFLN